MNKLFWDLIAIVISLIAAIGSCIIVVKSKKRLIDSQVSQEPLLKDEKVKVWIYTILNPVLTGAIMYFGLRKYFPTKAKQANKISFVGYGLWIAIYIIRMWFWTKRAGIF